MWWWYLIKAFLSCSPSALPFLPSAAAQCDVASDVASESTGDHNATRGIEVLSLPQPINSQLQNAAVCVYVSVCLQHKLDCSPQSRGEYLAGPLVGVHHSRVSQSLVPGSGGNVKAYRLHTAASGLMKHPADTVTKSSYSRGETSGKQTESLGFKTLSVMSHNWAQIRATTELMWWTVTPIQVKTKETRVSGGCVFHYKAAWFVLLVLHNSHCGNKYLQWVVVKTGQEAYRRADQ